MVVDATGIIRYIESGLMGHLNDAQTFGLMRKIGTELCFRSAFYWEIKYNNGNCIMTPYAACS